MNYTDILPVGTPGVVRSYASGIFVGRLAAGSGGTVVLTCWRWLRRWEGVGGEGSVYDLVQSDKTPSRRGPYSESEHILQQADFLVISEKAYERLCK